MRDDEMLTVEGRSAVRLQRRYPHPIEKVWRAVTTPEHLGQWFPSSVEVDLRVGGAMRFTFGLGDGAEGDGPAMTGEVVELDPPRLLAFTWGDAGLRFALAPDGDGTILTLTQTFDDTAGGASFATGWGLCLAGLAALLEGDALPEASRGVARHEELVTRFGLDRGTVTEADGRWTVRFERQLTAPAEVAWDLFLGVDPATDEPRAAPAVGEAFTPFAAPEVVLGTVTEVDPPRVLAFDAAPGEPGDHVRVELGEGTGHGARLILAVTGSVDRPDERDAATEQWKGAVAHVAAGAASWAEVHAPA